MQQGSDKLPIFATIGAAFRFFWQHRIQFYYLALPAVVVLSVLSTLATLAGPSTAFQFDLFGLHVQSGQELPAGAYTNSPWSVVLGVIGFVIMVAVFPLYSVAWHRLFLVAGEDVTIRQCYQWQPRHWSFLWSNIKIFILIIPIGIIGFFLAIFSLFLAPFVGLFVAIFVAICYGRFSMWLPASALDHTITLNEVFALTKGNGWQLAAILSLTAIATGILDGIASGVIMAAAGSVSVVGVLTSTLLANLALYIVLYAGAAVGITALSIAYQNLVEANSSMRAAP